MYLPSQFSAKERAQALDLMREYPLASLISTDHEQLPFVTHLPLHWEERGEKMVLQGHCALANPHWKYLQDRPKAVVTFMGPQAYMSAKVYPDLVRVPTWSYLAVHCTVQAHLLTDVDSKEQVLKQLIGDHDPAYDAQWHKLDRSYQLRMLSGIVAFELEVVDLQCKIKLNQHRPESHASMYSTYVQGNHDEQALAQWMLRLGLVEG